MASLLCLMQICSRAHLIGMPAYEMRKFVDAIVDDDDCVM